MSNDDVIHALAQMGVGREEAEIALENIEYPDHNLAMDWIDNNNDRLDELLMNRTLERTRQEAGRGQMRN
jgi:L-fucose mutarotase/ribose pyranase (RbsD/FucU family)